MDISSLSKLLLLSKLHKYLINWIRIRYSMYCYIRRYYVSENNGKYLALKL